MIINKILSNPWTISIFSAIISGAILVPLTNFLNKRNQKHKLDKANKEVINLLRTIIAEERTINPEIISSIRESMASKYSLNPDKLKATGLLIDDLIADIYESSYLSSLTKQDLTVTLLKIKKNLDSNDLRSSSKNLSKNILTLLYPLLIIGTVTLSTIILTTTNINNNTTANEKVPSLDITAFIALGSVLAGITTTILTLINTRTGNKVINNVSAFFGLIDDDDYYN